MRADPRQAEWQDVVLDRRGEGLETLRYQGGGEQQAAAIGQDAASFRAGGYDAKEGKAQQGGDDELNRGHLSRTPLPPVRLAALSPISSMPAAVRAAVSFINESTLPRIRPSLASI